jgi:hypothetical protein
MFLVIAINRRSMEEAEKMEIILYAPNSDQNDIRQRIEGLIPEKRLKIYRTLEGLSERLHRPIDPETIMIIVASSREKLSEVSPLRRILGDVRTVVVVSDQEPATVALAHQLRPRFLTYANSNLDDLAAVLQKMIESDRGDGVQRHKAVV